MHDETRMIFRARTRRKTWRNHGISNDNETDETIHRSHPSAGISCDFVPIMVGFRTDRFSATCERNLFRHQHSWVRGAKVQWRDLHRSSLAGPTQEQGKNVSKILVVLGIEVGGRWSKDALNFTRKPATAESSLPSFKKTLPSFKKTFTTAPSGRPSLLTPQPLPSLPASCLKNGVSTTISKEIFRRTPLFQRWPFSSTRSTSCPMRE